MNEIELNKYREVFEKKSNFLFSKKDIQLKVYYIEKLVLQNTPSCICLIYPLVKHENLTVRSKAVEAIIYFFDKIQTTNELYSYLKHIKINITDLEYYKKKFSFDIYIKLLIISSFNGDGYVRQQSVKAMQNTAHECIIKYLLIRLSDWVPTVRQSAIVALYSFFKLDFRECFISNLEAIQNLANVRRTDLKNIQNEILTFIYSDIPLDTINRFNDKIRLIYYRQLLLQPAISNQIIDAILFDRNYLIRTLLFRDIAQYDLATRKYIVCHSLTDSAARVRLNAIFTVNEFVDEFRSAILYLVSDASSTIRYIARKLHKGDVSYYRTVYCNNIICNHNLQNNLYGLADLIEQEDVTIFENYISHPLSKVRLACLTAINKIDKRKSYNYAITHITDSNTKIRCKAAEILSQYPDKDTINYLKRIYKDGNYELKKTILSVYDKIGGYSILGELIYALQEEDIRIVHQTWHYIFNWSKQATSLYSTPDKTDLESFKYIYSIIDKDKNKISFNQKKIWEELPFFLR